LKTLLGVGDNSCFEQEQVEESPKDSKVVGMGHPVGNTVVEGSTLVERSTSMDVDGTEVLAQDNKVTKSKEEHSTSVVEVGTVDRAEPRMESSPVHKPLPWRIHRRNKT